MATGFAERKDRTCNSIIFDSMFIPDLYLNKPELLNWYLICNLHPKLAARIWEKHYGI